MLLPGARFILSHCFMIFQYMTVPQVTHSVIGHLGGPQFAFMNNAAMNILLFTVEHL